MVIIRSEVKRIAKPLRLYLILYQIIVFIILALINSLDGENFKQIRKGVFLNEWVTL